MTTHAAVRRRQRGLTLIEIAVSTVVLAVVAFGVAASLMTGIAANRLYQRNTLVLARAQHYLETLNNLQVGQQADAAASADDLDLVFGSDPELGNDPPSLIALAKACDALPGDVYEFAPPGFGIAGTFVVRVTNNVSPALEYPAGVDADGDGVPDLGVASMSQGTFVPEDEGAGAFESQAADNGRELFGFEISFRPAQPQGAAAQLLLRSCRAQDP